MYISPSRSLSQEKIDDWTGDHHHFKELKTSICTGDYRLTAARKKELAAADLIIMTSEMLGSRARNFKSENNDFIKEVGTLVIDESHILAYQDRGPNMEAALMKFVEINPKARIILISATMPNVKEIAEWVSYSLTGRETHLLKSNWRPVPLTTHHESYWDGARSYQENERSKVKAALQIVEDNPNDKFLLFAHTKKTGELMKKELKLAGFDSEFHNADLSSDKRIEVENRFKTGDLPTIVATSTLAAGINMPSRRVVVLGVHRGLSEVSNLDIEQMGGRAGRPRYDKMGDAYILLPERHFDEWVVKLNTPQPIESQMLDNANGHHKILAFHIVSEIHHSNISNRDDVHNWYKKSLASFQSKELEEDVVDGVVELLLKCGAILEEDGRLKCTSIGIISSIFYYSPFDVANLKRGFTGVFNSNNENNDLWVSMALGNTDTHRNGIVSQADREEMSQYAGLIKRIFGEPYEPAVKAGYAYFNLMNGRTKMASLERNLQIDFPRVIEVLNALDNMSAKWNKRDFINTLGMRIAYGVEEHLIPLAQLPNIARVRSETLWNVGIKSPEDIIRNQEKAREVLKGTKMSVKEIDKLIEDASKKSMMK